MPLTLSGRESQKHASPVLSGWKDIAAYLGKAVRTVQRYELDLQLPIRRPSGKRRGSVLATRDELDLWVNASPLRHIPQRGDPSSPIFALKQSLSEMRLLRIQARDLRANFGTRRSALESNFAILAQHLSVRFEPPMRSIKLT